MRLLNKYAIYISYCTRRNYVYIALWSDIKWFAVHPIDEFNFNYFLHTDCEALKLNDGPKTTTLYEIVPVRKIYGELLIREETGKPFTSNQEST